MGQIVLKIRVAVRMLKESLPGLGEDWAGPTKKARLKRYKRLRKALPDIKTVIEKVIKPRIEGTRRMFKQDPARQINYTRAELEEMARNYLKGLKSGFKQETYDEAIEFGKKYTADKLTRQVIPFRGSRKYKIRGVGPFVARILTGDKNVRGELTPADELYQGGPIDITRPGGAGKFRKEFSNRMVQAGPRIMRDLANQRTRDNESVRTCQMANKYKRQDIEPFAPNGGSYVRFVVSPEATLKSRFRPASGRIDNQLFLEIQVSTV